MKRPDAHGAGVRHFLAGAAFAFASATAVGPAWTQDTARPIVARPVTAAELVGLRGLSGLSVSPDGAYAVVRMDHQDVGANQTFLDWQLVRLRDGRTARIADGGAPRWTNNGYLAVETPQWSPDGAWVYFRKLGGEEVQLWRTSRDGLRTEQLTHDSADVQAFVIASGGSVQYAVGPATREEIKAAEATEQDNGVLLDGAIISGFSITHNFPVNGRMATFRSLPTAMNLGRATLLGDTPLRVFSLEPRHGGIQPASDVQSARFADLWTQSFGGFRPFDPGEEGRAVSATLRRVASLEAPEAAEAEKPRATRSGRLLSWRGQGDAGAVCMDEICTDADHVTIVGWTDDGQTLIFKTRTFETVRLNAWNVTNNTVDTIVQTEGVLGSYDSGTGGECRIAGREAICIAAAADQPPRIVAIDLHTGHQRVLFNPNPGLSPDRLGVARKIILTDRFGSSTVGRLILPGAGEPQKRLPLVITSYTCDGFLLGGSGRDVPEHVLAGLGYAAICVDHGAAAVRRPEGFASTAINSELSGLDFFENAIHVLDQQGMVDPARVMLTGFSGSATNTTFAITRSRMFTAAAVTTGGSIDSIACYLTAHFRSCADLAVKQGFSRPYDTRAGILKTSPAWNVEKIGAPLLMQLPEVEYMGMMQLYGAMLDYGRAVEMYIYADAYHYKNQPKQRLAVYERNVDWANFWLQGIEAQEASRSAQSARWRAMREKQCELFAGGNASAEPSWYCPS